MASTANADPRFAALVLGYRQDFPDAVDARAPSWFCFIFHQAALIAAGNAETAMPAGSFLVVGPGDLVRHRPLAGRLQRSWLRCQGDAIGAVLAEAGLERGRPCTLTPADGAVDALLALHRALLHPHGCSTPHLLALFRCLVHTVARDAGAGRPATEGIAAVRRHLESSFMLTPRLDALAAMAGCSRAQFCRRFRTATGLSPGAYVLRLRIEAAAELLQGTGRPIADIASACGFSDRFHFGRVFARETGRPPAAYRRHLKAP